MDFSLNSELDITTNGTVDVSTESGLRTAVLLSLFTDRRAANDDEIPDGGTDRRGHWADAFTDKNQTAASSRLWLLQREKQTEQTRQRAIDYSNEALQWLIDADVIRSVNTEANWIRPGVLLIRTQLLLPDGSQFSDVFEYEVNG